jgi:hypothetical protein
VLDSVDERRRASKSRTGHRRQRSVLFVLSIGLPVRVGMNSDGHIDIL